MKIGVITIHDSKNYGANLQAYALISYLNSIDNVSAELIDLRRFEHSDFKKSSRFKILYFSKKYYNKQRLNILDKLYILSRRNIKRIIIFITKGYRKIQFRIRFHNELKERNFKFFLFSKKCKTSKRFYGIDDLYLNPPQYDVYLVGSDQVWNPYNNYNVEPYFLTFTNCTRKYTYASSIGTSEIAEYILSNYACWLEKFKCISVREESVKNTLEKIGVKNIRKDVDPTFLISPNEWKNLSSPCLIQGKYLFLFALSFSKEIFEKATAISEYLNLKIICIAKDYNDYSFLKKRIAKENILINIGIEDWLSLILYAECVVTDSFHGTVFSMYISKNFFSYIAPDNKKGTRIRNVLQLFNLEDHLIDKDFINKVPSEVISKNTFDYSVEGDLINKSKSYLMDICNDCC